MDGAAERRAPWLALGRALDDAPPWRETRGASSSILAHVSRPQMPSAMSGGWAAWNAVTAAAVSGP